MKPSYLKTIFNTDEERRTASILFNIIFAMLFACVVVIISGLYWNDWILVSVVLIASGSQVVPLVLLARGNVSISAVITIIGVLCLVTILATIGQGIHDIAIIAYPVIIVIASLLMPRRYFFLSSFLVVVAVGWLVLGESYGFFVSKTYQTPRLMDYLDVAVILAVAILVVDMLAENMRENMRQAQMEIARRKVIEEQLRAQSIHDGLTGIYNRTYFEEELKRLENSREFPVGIIVADVDDLKLVNDNLGHAIGDELLRRTTSLLHIVFRAGDVLARIGGDEFAVLLPRTEPETVIQILGRVIAKLAEYNEANPDMPIKLSIGISSAEQGNLTEAFVLADQRMYADKAARKSSQGLQTAKR